MKKILANESIEFTEPDNTEEEELERESDELSDSLDVAGDVYVESSDNVQAITEVLSAPRVDENSTKSYCKVLRVASVANESLMRVSSKLNMSPNTYTVSIENYVDPYTALEVSLEGFKETIIKMVEKIKEIWIKIKEVFKKLFRASMRKLQTSVTKLENIIKDLPASEETYKLSENADKSSYEKALKAADTCPPRSDNYNKVTGGGTLAEKIKELIPNLDGQTQATNKWSSEILSYSTTVKNSSKSDPKATNASPDAAKLEAVIKTAIDFTKAEPKYWKNSDLAANGATHLVIGHPNAGVFINKDKPEFKKVKMEVNDAEHTKYVNGLKNANVTIAQLKDLLPFLKEIPNKQEILNKAIDQAIAKIDRELLTGLDAMKNIKAPATTPTTTPNAGANQPATGAKPDSENKASSNASAGSVNIYKGLMTLVPVVLNGSYKQLGDAVNVGVAIAQNIKAQIGGGKSEDKGEEKKEEKTNESETNNE